MLKILFWLLLTVPLWPLAGVSLAQSQSSGQNQGQVLRAIYPTAPLSLDPQGLPDEAAWPIIMAAYDRLVTLKPGTAEPVPSVARRVLVSPDGLKYTFVLNEGLSFADGTAINSDAVLYTFDRLMSSEAGRRYYPHLYGFEAVGNYTFILKLRQPWPPFLASLALPMASLISPGLKGRDPQYLNDRSLGSGRYQVYDWRGDTIGLRLRPDLRAKPPVSFVMFHYESDPQKRYEKMLAHQAHLTVEPQAPAEAPPLPDTYRPLNVPSFAVRYLAFNTRRPYTQPQNARRALGWLIADIFKDRPGRLNGPFPEGLFYNAPSGFSQAVNQSVDRLAEARHILRQLGPPTGALTLAYWGGDQKLMEDAVLIAQTLRAYGFAINLKRLDGEEGNRIADSGDYDLYLDSRRSQIPSADMWLARFLDPLSPPASNPAFFQHPRAEKIIAEIGQTVGQPNDGPNDIRRVERERARLVAELAELAETEAPYVFLYQLEVPLIVDERLADLMPHPMWPEVWPLDQSNLSAYGPRSGENPTGRRRPSPPASELPKPAPPAAPQTPSPPVQAEETEAAAAAPSPEPAPEPSSQAPAQPEPEEELDYDDFYGPDELLADQ